MHACRYESSVVFRIEVLLNNTDPAEYDGNVLGIPVGRSGAPEEDYLRTVARSVRKVSLPS